MHVQCPPWSVEQYVRPIAYMYILGELAMCAFTDYVSHGLCSQSLPQCMPCIIARTAAHSLSVLIYILGGLLQQAPSQTVLWHPTTAMDAINEIIDQLNEVDTFRQSQMAIPGISPTQVQGAVTGLVSSTKAMLSQLPTIGMQAALRINAAIAGCTAITDGDRNELAAITSARALHSTAQAAAAASDKARMQTISEPRGIFTKRDWDIIDDPSSPEDRRIQRSVDRLRLMGMVNPHERPTLKNLVSLLAACFYKESPCTQTDVYRIVTTLRHGLHMARPQVHPQTNRLQTFPEDPRHWPADVFQLAYPEADDPPIWVDFPRYAEFQRWAKVRKEKDGPKREESHAPEVGPSIVHAMLQHMAPFFGKGWAKGGSPCGAQTCEIPWTDLRRGGRSPAIESVSDESPEDRSRIVPWQRCGADGDAGNAGGLAAAAASPSTSPAAMYGPAPRGVCLSSPQSLVRRLSNDMAGHEDHTTSALAAAAAKHPGDQASQIVQSGAATSGALVVAPKRSAELSVAELEAMARGKITCRGGAANSKATLRPAAAGATVIKPAPPTRRRLRGKCKGPRKCATDEAAAAKSKPATAEAAAVPKNASGSNPVGGSGTSSKAESRPALPQLVQGPAIRYLTGRIYIYPEQQVFRVYKKQGQRADYKIKFNQNGGSVEDSWAQACEKIELAHE